MLLFIPNSTLYSLYFNLPKYQLDRLQRIQNSLARTVVSTPKFSRLTSILNWSKFKRSSPSVAPFLPHHLLLSATLPFIPNPYPIPLPPILSSFISRRTDPLITLSPSSLLPPYHLFNLYFSFCFWHVRRIELIYRCLLLSALYSICELSWVTMYRHKTWLLNTVFKIMKKRTLH